MSSYLYLFEILLQLLHHFIDGDVEKLHLSGEFRESFFHKLLLAGLLDLLLGSCGNKVAQASLVVDDLIGGKQVVCLHGCVGIYLQQHGVFPDARYSLVFLVLARQNLIAQSLGYLYVYCFIVTEIHNLQILILRC